MTTDDVSHAQELAGLADRLVDPVPAVAAWVGVTVRRFTRPARPRWDDIVAPSICLIASTNGALAVVGGSRLDGGLHYVVVGSGRHFDCRIDVVSDERPVLVIVVELSPKLIRSVSASMRRSGAAIDPTTEANNLHGGAGRGAATPDAELVDAVVRLLASLSNAGDRHVLGPLRLQEVAYRVLSGDQGDRLLALVAHQEMGNPVAAVLDYIAAHLADPLTVHTLARQSCLSPSAFSRAFREVTGRSPYQYVKEARLDRARVLLDERRRGVADVSRAVGYTSVSHFIKGFRDRFGVTPGEYAHAHGLLHHGGRCPDCGSVASPCVAAS